MRQYLMIAGLIAFGLATTGGAVGLATGVGDEPKVAPRAVDLKPAAKAAAERPAPPASREARSPQGRVRGSQPGVRCSLSRFHDPGRKPGEGRRDSARLPGRRPPDLRPGGDCTAGSGRPGRHAVDHRAGRPQRQGRWAACRRVRPGGELDRPEFGDDPDAVRVGLDLDNGPTANRDNLLLNLYASARGRESKGLARLALGAVSRAQGHEGQGGPETGGPRRRSPTTTSSPPTGRSTR